MSCRNNNHNWILTKSKVIEGHIFAFYECQNCEDSKMEIDGEPV